MGADAVRSLPHRLLRARRLHVEVRALFAAALFTSAEDKDNLAAKLKKIDLNSLDLQRNELVGDEADFAVDARAPPVVGDLIVELDVVAFSKRQLAVGTRFEVEQRCGLVCVGVVFGLSIGVFGVGFGGRVADITEGWMEKVN